MALSSQRLSPATRTALKQIGVSVTLLPVPGSRDLAARLACVAMADTPSQDVLDGALGRAKEVRKYLLEEASLEHWMEKLADFHPDDQYRLAQEMVEDRLSQANMLSEVMVSLRSVLDRVATEG